MNQKTGEIGELRTMKEVYGEDKITELTERELATLKPLPLSERPGTLEEMRAKEEQLRKALGEHGADR